MAARKTTEQFITEARAIHGDLYIFDQTVYATRHEPVTFECRIHGAVSLRADAVLRGQGCSRCSYERPGGRNGRLVTGVDVFVKAARQVHGETYNYDEVEYTHCEEPVAIVCSRHGRFFREPTDHLFGRGCGECASEARSTGGLIPWESFLARAAATHGSRYTYDRASYVSMERSVRATCPQHGAFRCVAASHVRGKGCPGCPTAVPASGN